MLPSILSLLALLLHTIGANTTAIPPISRQICQSTGTHCPPGTLIVSPTSNHASHKTIQSAINSLPDDTTPQTILILAGTYIEQVNITRSGPITLLGQTSSPKDASRNRVRIVWAAGNRDSTGSIDNVFSSVLVVAPTLEASLTGSGPTGYPVPADTPFGNTDFRVYNIDFDNTWAEYSDGPAHALSLSRANGGFYYCGFYSYQDTVYIGKLGNAYFYQSILAGQTDFLYGFGTAWIQSSALQLRGCGGGITAWKGTNTTTPNKYGVYIVDSSVRAANASIAAEIKGACALGRPWNSQHRSIFARSYEDGSVDSRGYIDWVIGGVGRFEKGVTLMAEYRAFGPGYNKTGRVEGGVTDVLGWEGYEVYSAPQKVFEDTKWVDWGGGQGELRMGFDESLI
ncbi:Pectinesterase catalytic [Penicillium coprophilum]|uniref:Pectinesterase catalytic n=1 Tax=Penicillium coprophilum TaxID=36646 RepID=UPI0023933EFB|nr:Pectinesterase catalytic [Penicillium coprophilum]KAJ5154667.1 Pectinesterase catalytic [Penicillium coprophilum]